MKKPTAILHLYSIAIAIIATAILIRPDVFSLNIDIVYLYALAVAIQILPTIKIVLPNGTSIGPPDPKGDPKKDSTKGLETKTELKEESESILKLQIPSGELKSSKRFANAYESLIALLRHVGNYWYPDTTINYYIMTEADLIKKMHDVGYVSSDGLLNFSNAQLIYNSLIQGQRFNEDTLDSYSQYITESVGTIKSDIDRATKQ